MNHLIDFIYLFFWKKKAGVKQLKMQQMVLVGQIGSLEGKLSSTDANSSHGKKLAEALRLAKAHMRGINDELIVLQSEMPTKPTVPVSGFFKFFFFCDYLQCFFFFFFFF